jgi:hypothetical protein
MSAKSTNLGPRITGNLSEAISETSSSIVLMNAVIENLPFYDDVLFIASPDAVKTDVALHGPFYNPTNKPVSYLPAVCHHILRFVRLCWIHQTLKLFRSGISFLLIPKYGRTRNI